MVAPPEWIARQESRLVRAAWEYAARAHAGQTRKDNPAIPFLVHPESVAEILSQEGYPDAVVAAALLHDVVEDTQTTLADIEEQFGIEIAALVAAVTEPPKDALAWEARKDAYLEQLKEAPLNAVAIAVADKIHNLTSLRAAYLREGEALWEKFSRPLSQSWEFYERFAALARARLGAEHPLARTLEARLRELGEVVGEEIPSRED
ncbi:MAG: phosphohydrolase [Candidatus Parcubacteria bacterium]|nr:MAG: phosphohydrolase [Candidatus Parcubacteria bacterium]